MGLYLPDIKVVFTGALAGELGARERKSAQCSHGTVLVMLLADLQDILTIGATRGYIVKPRVWTVILY